MAIGDKTRKTLWGRSGNRCAVCKIELVAELNEHERNLNIGDECHIVSSKLDGPRHDPNFKQDFDVYRNLILLCKNHHKEVDELWETYTVSILLELKRTHEKWIKKALDQAHVKEASKPPRYLQRVKTGKQVVDIVAGAIAYGFDHDELTSQAEADFFSSFFSRLQDWAEFESEDCGIGGKIQKGVEMNLEVSELEELGFFIFGEKARYNIKAIKSAADDIWEVAVLIAVRKDNKAIVDSERLLIGSQLDRVIF